MFEAILTQGQLLRKIVESIKDLVSEVNIEASPTGLSLQAMYSAHVSLVSLSLNESGFESYRCDKPITLGINLSDLSKILKMSQNDDVITLRALEQNSYLTILFDNKKTEKSAEFQLNLLQLESESLGIPDTEYPSYIKMSSSEFVRLCKELTAMTDMVRVEVEGKTAVFTYNGKMGSGKIKMKKNNAENEVDQIDIKATESVSASYGLQYLNSFAKASSLSTRVGISLSPTYPLMIEYVIENMGMIKFYLAPKMDEDTNDK